MPARKPPDPNAEPQIERFREMARELECDEDEEASKVNDNIAGLSATWRSALKFKKGAPRGALYSSQPPAGNYVVDGHETIG